MEIDLIYYLAFKRVYDSLSEKEREWYIQCLNRPPLSEEEQKKQIIELISIIKKRKQDTEAS